MSTLQLTTMMSDIKPEVNKIAIIVAARRGFRSRLVADHARAFANGFIEAIASGKFDCINHRYYKGAKRPYSIYVLTKFIKTFYSFIFSSFTQLKQYVQIFVVCTFLLCLCTLILHALVIRS